MVTLTYGGCEMQCSATAHSTGERCNRSAIRGGNVCQVHGGSAPQVRAAAKRRLLEAADEVAAILVRIAISEDTDERVRLQAIRDLLDRAGIMTPKTVEVVTIDAIDAEIRRLEEELGLEHRPLPDPT